MRVPTITEAVERFNRNWPSLIVAKGEGPVYLTWGTGSKCYWLQQESQLTDNGEAHICTEEEFNAEVERLESHICTEDEMSIAQPLCKNCRWWKYRVDGAICDFPSTVQGERAKENGHGAYIEAYAMDNSDLEVFFRTGPDFGCVNFTPPTA